MCNAAGCGTRGGPNTWRDGRLALFNLNEFVYVD